MKLKELMQTTDLNEVLKEASILMGYDTEHKYIKLLGTMCLEFPDQFPDKDITDSVINIIPYHTAEIITVTTKNQEIYYIDAINKMSMSALMNMEVETKLDLTDEQKLAIIITQLWDEEDD